MPACSQILTGVISGTAIQTLINQYGGKRLYIPQQIHKNHFISRCIGLSEAAKLCQYAPRESIYIPKTHSLTLNMRNLDILTAHLQQTPLEQISARFNMTARNVRYIIKRSGIGNKTRTIIGVET